MVDLSNLRFFFLSLLSWKLSSFHLKEVCYGFSLAYINCQHHYSCALWSLLSKIKVTWTQALQYCNSQSDNQDSHKLTSGRVVNTAWIHWTKRWFTSQVGQSGRVHNLITVLRSPCNLKLMNCLFLQFSI